MCRDCILVLFLPLYLNLYTNIQTKLPFTKVFLVKQGSSRGSLQRFSSSFLQLNRSINLPFSELLEKEPRHHLVQNCLHSTFAVEQLPIHFLRVTCTEKRNVEKSSITVSVSVFFINNLKVHLDETKLMTLFHIFQSFC